VSEYRQIKLSCNEDFWGRYQAGKNAGLITDASGLGKLAISYGLEHGQATTEALLRNGNPQHRPDHEAAELLEQLLEYVAALSHESAERAGDVKRCVMRCTAMLVGLLVLLAIGIALYLRPVRTA
jgi:hypothetical protein